MDGTLETSAGPVTVNRLQQLMGIPDCTVVIVSGSNARPSGFTERNKWGRLESLQKTKEDFPADLYLYVSDNGDVQFAKDAGFSYIDRLNFV